MRPLIKTETDWGFVPALDGSLPYAQAPFLDPEAQSPTTAQQAEVAAVRATAQAISFPAAPYATKVTEPSGIATIPWIVWFSKISTQFSSLALGVEDVSELTANESSPVDVDARELVQALSMDFQLPRMAAQQGSDQLFKALLQNGYSDIRRRLSDLEAFVAEKADITHSHKLKYFQENAVFPKASGIGLQVDTVTPTFPWRDLTGDQVADLAGANSPKLLAVRGGRTRLYAYTTNDMMDVRLHVPHDYVPGTDLYIHLHWLHNGTAISGNMVASFATTYAKGHNQANFGAEKTVSVTYNTVNIATTPQYRHRIEEVQLSSAGGSATLLNSADIEVDGMLIINFKLDTLPTITGGATNRIFVPYVDIHYQSTGVGTKQKAPPFWT